MYFLMVYFLFHRRRPTSVIKCYDLHFLAACRIVYSRSPKTLNQFSTACCCGFIPPNLLHLKWNCSYWNTVKRWSPTLCLLLSARLFSLFLVNLTNCNRFHHYRWESSNNEIWQDYWSTSSHLCRSCSLSRRSPKTVSYIRLHISAKSMNFYLFSFTLVVTCQSTWDFPPVCDSLPLWS